MSGVFPNPQLDPSDDSILEQKVAIPYVTTAPTAVAPNGTRRIYFDGSAYWLYVYANGGWRTEKLDGAGSLPTDLNITGQAQGDVLYFNGTNWVRLAAGTSGYSLKTSGASANPSWDKANQYFNGTVHGASGVFVDNTNVETTVATLSSVPAMGANDMLQFEFFISLDNNNQTNDVARIKVGTTTLHTFASQNSAGSALFGRGVVTNLNATNSQRSVMMGAIWQNTPLTIESSTSAADLSNQFNITFTYQIPLASLEKTVTVSFFNVQIIRA